MQQRVRKRYRGKIPSSSGQLPVPVALNAELPTLFGCIIHDFTGFVNTFFRNSWKRRPGGRTVSCGFPPRLAHFPRFPISRTVK